jgi:NADH:ubiquinone oxidoreductase subunit C
MKDEILIEKTQNTIFTNEKKILKMLKSSLNKEELYQISDIYKNNDNKIKDDFFSIVYHLLSFKYKSEISKNDFILFCNNNFKQIFKLI